MKAQILIVDDDPVQRKLLHKWLSLDDYQVIAAKDGTEAWHKALVDPPHLVISDWMMPGMTGLALCEKLRTTPKTSHCYIILLTARDDSDSLSVGLETGADEFLTKPIDGARLRARVKAGLRHYQERTTLLAANAQLESLAVTDPLTGTGNRRALGSALDSLLDCWTSKRPVSVLLIDCDHFKRINDLHGHHTGDEVLIGFAERMRAYLRDRNALFRYGGEEFVVLLDATHGEQAWQVANRLCAATRLAPIQTTGGPISLTISIGVAQAQFGDEPASVLVRADGALYQAKHSGRDRAVQAQPQEPNRVIELMSENLPYGGYFLFDPYYQKAQQLADLLPDHRQLTVIDTVALHSAAACDFSHLKLLFETLLTTLGPQRVKQLRIFATTGLPTAESPINAALRSLPLQQFLLHTEVCACLEAMDARHLYSVFQPIFSLKDDACLGHEMLIRARTVGGVELSAADIFEYIESTNRLAEFDELSRMVHLETVGRSKPDGLIFLNMVPGVPQVAAREVPRLVATIAQLGRPLSQYVLEVTTAQQQSVQTLEASLRLYQEAGFRIALDDLGASSVPLASLIDLEPAFAKLDRSLISRLDTDPSRQFLVQMLTELAHRRGTLVIAEGIERTEEIACCRKLGIDYAQGFLLGRPQEKPLQSALKQNQF